MALRWIFGPTVIDPGNGAVRPLVGTLLDPSRPRMGDEGPTFKELTHSTIYNPGYTRALSLVGGTDLSQIDATAGLHDLLEEQYPRAERGTFLHNRIADLGWSQAKINRIKERFAARGVTISETDRFHRWLTLAGRRMRPGFDARLARYSGWR